LAAGEDNAAWVKEEGHPWDGSDDADRMGVVGKLNDPGGIRPGGQGKRAGFEGGAIGQDRVVDGAGLLLIDADIIDLVAGAGGSGSVDGASHISPPIALFNRRWKS